MPPLIRPPPPSLSPREKQVVEFVSQGCTNPEIADKLGIATETVKEYMEHIFKKTGLRNRVQVAVWAMEVKR